MKTNVELKLPRSKKSYYMTIAIEIIVIVIFVIFCAWYVGQKLLLGIILIYMPLRRLFNPMSLIINDEGIALFGYDSSTEEPVFYSWKQVYAIGLHDNSTKWFKLREIIIYIKGPSELIRIDVDRVYDLMDHIYIGRYNKRVRDALQQLCKGHGVKFVID